MKTTIQISDALLEQAKEQARRQGTTLRELVEEGLRRVLKEKKSRKPFRLRDSSFGGKGVAPDIEEGRWEQIRSLIYEGRGG